MTRKCPYGFEGDDLPCKLDPDNFDCKTCAIVELTQVLQDLVDNGIKMIVVPIEVEEENLGEIPRRRRKLKT